MREKLGEMEVYKVENKSLYEKYEDWFVAKQSQAFWAHVGLFLFSFLLWGTQTHWFYKAGAMLCFVFSIYRIIMLIKLRK